MELFTYIPGRLPFILSIPHAGTFVPLAILERFTPDAKQLPDTDWHIPQLYDFAGEMGLHVLAATHSRYVIDLNRAPDGSSLYPGKFTTGLCPTMRFDGSPIYTTGKELRDEEITARHAQYWQPYHQKLVSLITTLKDTHGHITLFDAHSIRSHVPTLFDGQLPDLNFGTADGATMPDSCVEPLLNCAHASGFSHVLNGRFKGGYITRHYGNPAAGIHAIQLELTQANYMDEDRFTYDSAKALRLKQTLGALIEILVKDPKR